MIVKFVSFPFLFIVLVSSSLARQVNDPLLFAIDDLKEAVTLNRFWKYHPGDDTLWAYPDYDDQYWDTLSTELDLSRLDEEQFNGLCWFRLHIRIDSSIMDKAFALLMDQQGASEIYLNGELIQSWGEFSDSDANQRTTNPKILPGLIQFGQTSDYVLAVRYSNHRAWNNYKYFRESEAGFTLRIREHHQAIQSLFGQVNATYLVFFLFMVFFVLSLVHFLLYIFYRKQKSNLYYSIFMLLFSGLIFIMFLSNSASEYPPLMIRASFILSLAFPLFFIPLTGFLYSLFMEKTPWMFYITIGLALLLLILYYASVSFISVLYVSFVFLMWIEVTRIVIMAMLKKYDGAWIIGIGVLFFILFFTFVMIYIIRYGDLVMEDQSLLSLIFFSLLMLAILSIPISMSIYLARDFARTNINLSKQLEQVKILSAKTLEQEREKKRILEGQKEKLEILVSERTKELAAEKEKTEELLLNTLPLKVVNELKENGKSEPESFDDVTVYFSDIVGFTSISSKLEPHVLIEKLNEIFTAFDDIMEKHGCERIKTIGDAYMVVCGMPERKENHAESMVEAALEIKKFMEDRNKSSKFQWQIRIGIHSGRVVGGIVGVKKYIYDVFGDTINTTSRMESNSEPMRINVSETTYLLVKDKYTFINREPLEIKGKGEMRMYFLEGRKMENGKSKINNGQWI